MLTIHDALNDPALFGRWFRGSSWTPWRAFLAAVFGLTMTPDELALYQTHTRRTTPPTSPFREAWLIVGRRGGKSRIASAVAVFLAAFRDYREILAPGERGVVMLLAADRRQANVIKRYTESLIDNVPMLQQLVAHRTRESIQLTNGISIEIHTSNYRSVRGYTIVAAIADEVAFWRDDSSSNPDVEVLNALRPAMATVRGGLLLCLSTPYGRRGALWDAFRNHFGQDEDPVLVWQSDSASMNPNVDQRVIADAYEADPESAAAEYGAEFRKDIEAFITREAIEAVVVPERRELPPVADIPYVGFVDPSGGSQDAMTLAIAHAEFRDGHVVGVLDAIRECRPPFSPEVVVDDFARTLLRYGVRTVVGDHYGGEWPPEAFRRAGIEYLVAESRKSDLYRDLLPAINSARIELLDDSRLITQLCLLERRTGRGGRDTIDHPPRAHDDSANAAAGALILALTTPVEVPSYEMSLDEYRSLRRAFGDFFHHPQFDDIVRPDWD
jgi:hypothetical protein